MTLERIADTRCRTGENPLWHPDEGVLYWCDIPRGELYRYDPHLDDHERVYETERAIGGFTIQADGDLLLFESAGRIERWSDGRVETVLESIPAEVDSRFNDVLADPDGRVFAGTMPTDERLGRLYRIDRDGSYRIVFDDLEIPTGMAFTADLQTLYLTESEAQTVHRFDYDEKTGELSNHGIFLVTPDEPGVSDGMTIDAEGDIWSARWNGGVLVRYDREGSELERIEFPSRKVASVTFGGPNYRNRYVTTAGGADRAAKGDGAVFRMPAEVRGRAEFRSRIDP